MQYLSGPRQTRRGSFRGSSKHPDDQICAFLSNVGQIGRMIADGSRVTEPIDFGVEYMKAQLSCEKSALSRSESLESALKYQLRVKLTPLKSRIDVPIIDRLEPLTAD